MAQYIFERKEMDKEKQSFLVPTIDISRWYQGSAEEKKKTAQTIVEACRGAGFFKVNK